MNQYQKGVEPNYAYMPVLFETAELRDKVYTGLRQKNIFQENIFIRLLRMQPALGTNTKRMI